MFGEIRPERTGGGAGRRILADVGAAVEHPRHDVAVAADREQVEGLGLGGGADHAASRVVPSCPAQRRLVAHRHHQVRETGRARDDRQPVDQVLRLEAGRARDRRSILELVTERRRELLHPRHAARHVDLHRDVPRRRRLHHVRADAILRREGEGRAERRVSRERQLRIGGEDPDVVAAVADTGHVRRLREPDLERERLHGRRVQARGRIGHDAEPVPRERHGREHVDDAERDLHGGQYRSCYAGVRNDAGVAQWQSSSLPSWLCGFDSRHPL